MIRTIAELVGLLCLVIAAFLIHLALGFAALGVGLILAANFGGRLDYPAEPPGDARRA